MKKIAVWLMIILFVMLLAGCEGNLQEVIPQLAPEIEVPALDTPTAVTAVDSEQPQEEPEVETADETSDMEEDTVEETEMDGPPSEPLSFIPVTIEELGIASQVPAEWPKIKGDELLENAWGPGEYTFIAFYEVPGDDSRAAMAELLNASADELAANEIEGFYEEKRIGNYDWALYSIDNPDVNLAQSVSMTTQDGSIYVVSLFVETDDQDLIMNAALENFAIGGEFPEELAGEETGPPIQNLAGTSWVMTAYNDGSGQMVDVLTGQIITAVFDNQGRLSGFAGCNNYGSLYAVAGEQLSLEPLVFTSKECAEPEGIMEQETSFLANMDKAASFQATKNDLKLFDEAGALILTLWAP